MATPMGNQKFTIAIVTAGLGLLTSVATMLYGQRATDHDKIVALEEKNNAYALRLERIENKLDAELEFHHRR